MSLRNSLRFIRRSLGLSPMRRLLRRLRQRGVELADRSAIEIFGGSGAFHTMDYAKRVASLDVWEIDPACRADLERNLPGATIRTVDSFDEVRRTTARFGWVVVDNPMSIWAAHCEHFDMMPYVFALAGEGAVVVLNVIPHATARGRRRFRHILGPEHLAQRRDFYGTSSPENVSIEQMVEVYRRHAAKYGLRIVWYESVRRHVVYYLALGIERV